MDSSSIINQLRQNKVANFFEVYHQTYFECYRNAKNGSVQEVLVKILDSGQSEGQRYHCIATSKDGKTATGNPAESIELAISWVHWHDLDK